MLTYLLQNGLSDLINQVNILGESPLYYACLNGHVECVRILLESGCYVSENIINDIICQNINQQQIINSQISNNDDNRNHGNESSIQNEILQLEKKTAIMRLLGRI